MFSSMVERMRVTLVPGPDTRVSDAIVVMLFDITKGVWQAFGGGQFLKTILVLYTRSSLTTITPRALSGPGFV